MSKMNTKDFNNAAIIIQKFYYKYVKDNSINYYDRYDRYEDYDRYNRYDRCEDYDDNYMFTTMNGDGTNDWEEYYDSIYI